jgi:hypothetical protein
MSVHGVISYTKLFCSYLHNRCYNNNERRLKFFDNPKQQVYMCNKCICDNYCLPWCSVCSKWIGRGDAPGRILSFTPAIEIRSNYVQQYITVFTVIFSWLTSVPNSPYSDKIIILIPTARDNTRIEIFTTSTAPKSCVREKVKCALRNSKMNVIIT